MEIKFYLYPPLPPLSLISLSPRSPLSQPPLMRKQYNFNTEHGRQLGGEKADFPRSFIEREFRTCPFHLFLDLHLFLFLLVRDILAPCCSPIQKTKKGGVSITVSTCYPTKDHAPQFNFLPCPPLAHCAGMFLTVGQSQASQPLAARP